MNTNQSCNDLRQSLVKSNLHYFLNESPHSIWITIRKKFLTPQAYYSPPDEVSDQQFVSEEILDLRKQNHNLKNLLDTNRLETEETQSELVIVKEEFERKLSHAEEEIKALERKNELLEQKLEDTKINLDTLKQANDTLENHEIIYLEEIKALESHNAKLKEISQKLQNEVLEAKTRFKTKQVEVAKDFEAEIKHWKKELGLERQKKINLEKQLKIKENPDPEGIILTTSPSHISCKLATTSTYSSSNLATTSSSSSSSLATTTSSSSSSSNLATTSAKTYKNLQDSRTVCLHPLQCVSRQPKPPPPDKCTILVNHRSKYHEHIVSKDGVPSRYGTHDYCMRIDHPNYGCEECVWYKWWGELHGYPDTSPWQYKQHVDPSKWPELGLW